MNSEIVRFGYTEINYTAKNNILNNENNTWTLLPICDSNKNSTEEN